MSDALKRWEGLTTSGQLLIGVYFAGKRHKDFVLRVPVAGDMIGAQQDHPQGPLQALSVAAYRRQLLSLGEIPAESLTTSLLMDELAEVDLAILADADAALEKKLKLPSEAAPEAGEPSSTPLSGTATA